MDIKSEAARWLLLEESGLDRTQAAAFEAWLSADPRHQSEYAQMRGVWSDLDQTEDSDIEKLLATLPPPPAREWRRWIPRTVFAGLAMVLVIGGSWSWLQWSAQQPTFSQQYATQRGQQRSVTLPDGSKLQLDTDTAISVTFRRDQREVVLERGRSMFTVMPVQDQPFDVLAAGMRVHVVGTRFSVTRGGAADDAGDAVEVAVEEGHVRFGPAAADIHLDAIDLYAGQMVAAHDGQPDASVRQIDPETIATWRDGWVLFDDVPLLDALAEFERYGDTHLMIRDAQVASLRITGSFNVRRIEVFARSLPLVLPVELQQQGAVVEIVRR